MSAVQTLIDTRNAHAADVLVYLATASRMVDGHAITEGQVLRVADSAPLLSLPMSPSEVAELQGHLTLLDVLLASEKFDWVNLFESSEDVAYALRETADCHCNAEALRIIRLADYVMGEWADTGDSVAMAAMYQIRVIWNG